MRVEIKRECIVMTDWEISKWINLEDAEKLAHDILDEIQHHRTRGCEGLNLPKEVFENI
jgi:hypothetical protein